MLKQHWPSPGEKLGQYRKHARDAYAKARRSIVPAERDAYTAMAEQWNERAGWLESEMRAKEESDAGRSRAPRPAKGQEARR